MGTDDHILTVNAGSSSIKLDLFFVNNNSGTFERIINATIKDIGQPSASLYVRHSAEDETTTSITANDQEQAIDVLIDWLVHLPDERHVGAIGHRIVHGGPHHDKPVLITTELLNELETYSAFDPEHTPAALQLIRVMRERFSEVTQVACFDTAFFHDLPRIAQLLPLPRRYEAEGLRRYGFHGLSYSYLLERFRVVAGDNAAHGRIIFAHLGSGASLAALKNGAPIDTTMSFTPASGVLMSSRSGDLDPSIAGYLQRTHGMSTDEFTHLINYESGLLGVSETTADMYALLQNQADDVRAAEAVELFVYNIQKAIGALTATIDGLDSLLFTGGIGEKSAELRARICAGLGYLGINIDADENQRSSELISSPESSVGVHVIPTDEAHVIAEHVFQTLQTPNEGEVWNQ